MLLVPGMIGAPRELAFGLGAMGRSALSGGLVGAGLGAIGGVLTKRKDQGFLDAAAGGALTGGALGAAGGSLPGFDSGVVVVSGRSGWAATDLSPSCVGSV